MAGFKYLCTIGVLMMIVIPTSGQSIVGYESYFDNYLIRNIGIEEGLPSEPVFYTYEDSLGFIWIVSSAGLVRYDGLSIKQFNTGYTGGFLYEAHEDEDGHLWIPSVNTGVHKFDGKKFTAYKNELESEEGLAKTMFVSSNGNYFIGMYGVGLIEFDGEKVLARYSEEDGLVANTIWRIIEDRYGRIWIGTDNGASILDGGKFTNFTSENGLPHNKIRGLTEMFNGDIWIGTDGGGIAVFRDAKPYKYYNSQHGLSGDFPQFFGQNPVDKSIWIAHHGQGLDIFNNGKFEGITEQEGLPSNFLTYIGFSKDGTGHIGSEMGLSIFTRKLVSTINKNTPGIEINPSISVIEEKDKTVWIGLEGKGFRYFSDHEWSKLEDPPEFTNGYANGAARDPEGGVWFSTQGSGIIKIKDQKIVAHISEKDGMINDFSNGLAFDNEGLLWVGTNKGINVINKDHEIIRSYTTKDGLLNNYCLTMSSSSDGSIWYGSYGGGLARFYKNEITVFDSTSGVFGSSIFSVFEHSNGDVLITGEKGVISVFNNENMVYYDTEAGIPNTVFYGMSEDEKGNIWISSPIGVFKIDIDEYNQLRKNEISRVNYSHYTTEDGLPTRRLESGTNAVSTRIHTGEILFASSQGTVVIDPEKAIIETASFAPYIDEFIVDENPLPVNSIRELTPKDKKIEISYSALNIKSPKKTKFRIKLEGIDEEWVYVENRTSAYYDYLPDGKYIFHVSAIGPDGQWNKKTASIDFTVLPPFYKTWWFMSLSLMGFIAIGAGGVQIRSNMKLEKLNRELETQQKIQKERERISRELHDNVGSQITNLITGIEVSNLHVKKNQQDKALSLLGNLDTDARGAMTDLRETIWLLDKEEVEFEAFIEHLNGYLNRQKRYSKGLEIKLDSTIDNECVLEPGQSMNLTRIIQEALNNSRKYAEANEFIISFRLENQKLYVNLVDDGKGMDLDEEINKGNGIRNMSHRAEEMDAKFQIKSDGISGVEIEMSFDVKIP